MIDKRPELTKSSAGVCVAGMHRSGTSMVAQMLSSCGLHLGDSRQFTEPIGSNADGHWEHQRFVELNDRLLDRMGAGWDLPPEIDVDWTSAQLDELRREAQELVRELEICSPWGWKDPRNSLTLPFWTDIRPDLRVVVPLRDPVEVALSLQRRNAFSKAFCFRLWLRYHAALDAYCPRERRLVTHYDSLLSQPEDELMRILTFLKLPVPPSIISRAARSVKRDLRHHAQSAATAETEMQPEVAELYRKFCEEARVPRGTGARAPTLRGQTNGEDALQTADTRQWWRRHIASPAKRVVFHATGTAWLVSHQERQLRELRAQLASRITWEQELGYDGTTPAVRDSIETAES